MATKDLFEVKKLATKVSEFFTNLVEREHHENQFELPFKHSHPEKDSSLRWPVEYRESEDLTDAELWIAMCYFHVKQAIHNNAHLLPDPKNDILEAARNVSQLALCPPIIFGRAWAAVRTDWEEKEWTKWLRRHRSRAKLGSLDKSGARHRGWS